MLDFIENLGVIFRNTFCCLVGFLDCKSRDHAVCIFLFTGKRLNILGHFFTHFVSVRRMRAWQDRHTAIIIEHIHALTCKY
ncbi:hypothetical protein WK78_30360 [Burkholderia cepacia]|nr:hypothetical protein WK78_30360 [Burkholderia cepacia]